MKTSKVFQHANLDKALLQSQNSLIGIINEIADISSGAVDQHSFVVLNNAKKHEISGILHADTIKTSTFGAKKLFLTEVIQKLKTQLQADGITLPGSNKFPTILNDNFFDNATHATLNDGIEQLRHAFNAYLRSKTLELGKRHGHNLGVSVADILHALDTNLSSTLKEVTATNEADIQQKMQMFITQATTQLSMMDTLPDIRRSGGIIYAPAQTDANGQFIIGFSEAGSKKSLTDVFKQYGVDAGAPTIKDYASNPEHLKAAMQLVIVGCAGSYQQKGAAEIAQAKKEAAEDQEMLVNIEKFKAFVARAETIMDSTTSSEITCPEVIFSEKGELATYIQGMPPRLFEGFKIAILQDPNIQTQTTALGYFDKLKDTSDEHEGFKDKTTATAIPAGIAQNCLHKLNEAKAFKATIEGALSESVLAYTDGMTSEDNANVKAQLTLINKIPHQLSSIFGNLKQSTTGSSRFF